jgi:DNA-directed RNA polymerase subunit M/transcription elongation factor TFIIS
MMTEHAPTDDRYDAGVRCPRCESALSLVTKTRRLPDGRIRRYRECSHCAKVWRTLETAEFAADDGRDGPYLDNPG